MNILAAAPQAQGFQRQRQRAFTREAEEAFDESGRLSEAQLVSAVKVIDFLSGPGRHVQQGETIRFLYERYGTELDERDFRRAIRMLEVRRLLVIDNKGNYGRARKGSLVKLRSQDLKNRWKGSREGIVNQLRQPYLKSSRPS
jgi:hypothetical protein